MRALATLVLLLGFTARVHAFESVAVGVENYHWSEYDSSGATLLTESGPRLIADYQQFSEDSDGFSLFSARSYFGDVAYDGALLDGTPYSANTGYYGLRIEQSRQFKLASNPLRADLGLGAEWWLRILDKGGSAGYAENYLTLYSRAGLAMGRLQSGWYGKAGVQYPLMVNETVIGVRDLSYSYDSLQLKPKPSVSLYAEIGYAYPSWAWRLYYGGYRFEASDPVAATSGGLATGNHFYQPHSVMDRIGLSFSRQL